MWVNIEFSEAQSLGEGKNELSISEGILSVDQLIGIFNGAGPVSTYMSFPYSVSGAAFVTYRRNISKRFSVGFTAGLDNQRGDISYGDEHHGGFGGYEGVSGNYKRRAYTFAPEGTFVYFRKRCFMLYGYVGVAYTVAFTEFTFFQNINDPQYFYGTSTSLVPTNPYKWEDSHVNGQFTPIGMRFGNKFAGFIEIGPGYKGLFSGGMSVRF